MRPWQPAENCREVAVANHMGRLQFEEAAVVRLFHALDQWRPGRLAEGELSIVFLDAAAMAELHGRFLDDPTPTDVITFPGDGAGFAGEICVGVEAAEVFARQGGIFFAEELTRYLLHGWLHLIGYDDHDPKDRRRMKEAERRLLKRTILDRMLPAFRLTPGS